MLPQPFEVEIVGKECEWIIPLIGPLLIAIGALGAALLTVRTANRRHREQLAHDRELQDEQLKHDRDMRGLQLAQERLLRYRELVQQLLDTVLENSQTLRRRIGELAISVEDVERERNDITNELPGDVSDNSGATKRWLEMQITLYKESGDVQLQIGNAHADTIRLRLRLGAHEIVTRHSKLADSVDRLADLLREANENNRTPDQRQAEKQADEAVEKAYAQFLKACEAWHLSFQLEPAD